ncbi:MAG: type IV secretion system DNA-binding domain-containing protein [Desulfamplus sp.]|nr:type IV secretion system DNA-binding domain-containing protein [Desulfamplus sp.]
MKYFPIIAVKKINNKVRGFAGLELQSITQGELLLIDSAVRDINISALNKMHPGLLQNVRESFIRSLSELDSALSLELYITAFPSLVTPTENKLEIQMLICGEDVSEEELKDKIVSAFLNLKPVLSAMFPEADFKPITEAAALYKVRNYDNFNYAVSIDRRIANVSLGMLFGEKQIGFSADVDKNMHASEKTVVRHLFQWQPSFNDWSQLINTMLNQLDPNRILIRLKSVPLKKETLQSLKNTISVCDQFLVSAGAENATLKEQASAIRKQTLSRIGKLMEESFFVGVFLLTSNISNRFLGKILGSSITSSKGSSEENSFWEGGFRISNISVKKAVTINYYSDNEEPFTAAEASCAFRLPNPPFEQIPPGFPVKRFRTALAMITNKTNDPDSIILADNIHQGIEKPVMVDRENRLRHCFILGQTGSGKSTLMKNMIIQDIQAGRGAAVIDPHGEMIDSLLGQIPMERAEDVILFDPLDIERPIGFNILEWNTIQERDLIIDELYQIFHHIYNFEKTGGPVFELYFRGALALLMGDKKRTGFIPTILDFALFFLDGKFRRYLKETTHDVCLHDFLKQAEEAGGDTALANITPYITSKITRFQDTTLKRIFGQESTSFNFDKILDKGKIVLIKLGKGRFGQVTSALLANMIVSRFKLAAMKRSEKAPSERRDFFLYIDEAHNLPAENFMELLSEARKYNVGLILATQYAAQLTKSSKGSKDNLLSALLGNVGQTITFRLGQEDAAAIGETLSPVFGMRDIIALPNWHGYVRMQQNSNSISPFSIRTIMNKTPYNSNIANMIRKLSRSNYGMDSAIVDKMILKRRTTWKD